MKPKDIIESLKADHEQGLCSCDLTEGGYGLCLYGQYENGIITLDELTDEINSPI